MLWRTMRECLVELERDGLQVPRRAILIGGFGIAAAAKWRSAAAAAHVDIEYHGGSIYWPSGRARAVVGAGGVSQNKKEGDRATPAGTFPLPSGCIGVTALSFRTRISR